MRYPTFLTVVISMGEMMKSRNFCRLTAIMMLIAVLILNMVVVANAADTGQFDLDVIFVIDNSGSMLRADPNKLALSASNLFIDMCEDSNSRIGYVMFTDTIASSQPLTDISIFSKELKKAISSTPYQQKGDTDTALGLEKALEMLELDALNGKSSRKPVIILLSDGNTDLPNPVNRTTEQSLAALQVITDKLTKKGIPVYTIGFNYDGKLDVEAMRKIAETTGAMAQEAKTADELPLVLRRIYGDLTGANSISFPVIKATGKPQSVTIPIDNESIYKATITIMSKNAIKDVSLKSPDGNVYDESDTSGKLTTNKDPSGKYTLLSLYNPVKGDWTLTFTGTKDDVVSIDLLSVYDLKLVMDLPTATFAKTDISWHLEDADGNNVADASLIAGLAVTFHANNDSVVEVFPAGQASASFALAPGDYEAYLTMESGDIARTSNTIKFTVPAGSPVAIKNKSADTVTITLVTLFKEEKEVYVDELIAYAEYNRPLGISFTSGGWEDFVKLDYDTIDETITVSALKSGESETGVTVTGSDGSKASFYIAAKILSGWWFVIGAAVLLLIVAVLVVFMLYRRKPYLDTPMRDFPIQVNLPIDEIGYQPSEASFRLEHRKEKRTLQQIIDFNHADDYNTAFQNIKWFTAGTAFKAINTNTIEVTVPVNNRFNVVVDGRKVTSPLTRQLSKNRQIVIRLLASEDNEYEIIFGSQSDVQWESVFDDGFTTAGGKAPTDDFDF